MNGPPQWIDPELGASIIIWLGWFLAALGAFKVVVYLVGEIAPGVWDRVPSSFLRRLLTGTGNRLLFGLGGILTVLFGIGAVGIGFMLRYLYGLS